ncbi:MAG: hypothetical protein WA790_03205 [Sulfitobacter sp.]
MPNINIPKNDHGKVYVFALSMSDHAAQALHDNDSLDADNERDPQAIALGVGVVDANHTEVFRVADLDTLGLAGYLRDGIDVNESEIAKDATKLAAVDGWVMLVHSMAFGGAEVTLDPIPELTLIGTYTQEQGDNTAISLESEAAAPYTGSPAASPPIPPSGRAGGSLVVVGLAVLAALILWWALS